MLEDIVVTRFWLPAKLNRREFMQVFQESFPQGGIAYVNIERMPDKMNLLFHPEVDVFRRRQLTAQLWPVCFVFDLGIPQNQKADLDCFLSDYPKMNGCRSFYRRVEASGTTILQTTLR